MSVVSHERRRAIRMIAVERSIDDFSRGAVVEIRARPQLDIAILNCDVEIVNQASVGPRLVRRVCHFANAATNERLHDSVLCSAQDAQQLSHETE